MPVSCWCWCWVLMKATSNANRRIVIMIYVVRKNGFYKKTTRAPSVKNGLLRMHTPPPASICRLRRNLPKAPSFAPVSLFTVPIPMIIIIRELDTKKWVTSDDVIGGMSGVEGFLREREREVDKNKPVPFFPYKRLSTKMLSIHCKTREYW